MPPKILTVDDSKTIRMIVAKAFKPYDCAILEAGNGLEGYTLAAKEKPDLIILDITMPVLDGYGMLSRLRADRELKQIPVIMLTAEVGRDNVIKVARQGVRDYVVKPFKEDLIVERVGRVIELKLRSAATGRVRNYDEPLKLVVLDDKPAIAEQIRAGVADTCWEILPKSQPAEVLELCQQQPVDAVLVSLALADDAAFTTFEALRGNAQTRALPVFGLSVKTAADEQARAAHLGFTAVINKPIDLDDLKFKIARALNLDTSPKFFRDQKGVLILTIPTGFNASVANEISGHLKTKVAAAVDAGINKLVLDISQARAADITLIRLAIETAQWCARLSLTQRVVGTANLIKDCKNYEEAKDWRFAASLDEALAAFEGKEPAPAAAAAAVATPAPVPATAPAPAPEAIAA